MDTADAQIGSRVHDSEWGYEMEVEGLRLSPFWLFVYLEQWIYSKTEATRLGCFYNACIRFSLYTFFDRVRGPVWR